MGVSINLLSLLETLLKSRYRSRDRIADYLDQVAAEARTIAEIWDTVISELQSGAGKFSPDSNLRNVLARYNAPNAGPFFRLDEFYHEFSKATDGKLDKEWRENILSHLGGLLYHRDITLEKYQEALKNIHNPIFVADDNLLADFKDLSHLSMALHKEAAALDVLAKSFRVVQG